MSEKVGTKDRLLDISNDEYPWQRSSESKVESEGAFTVGFDGRFVDSGEREGVRGAATVGRGWGNYANF